MTTAGRLPAPDPQRRSLQALAGVVAGATITGIELFAAAGYQEAAGPHRHPQFAFVLGIHLVLTVLWGPLIGLAVGVAPSRRKVLSGAIISSGVTGFVLALAVGSPWGSVGVPSIADLSWADRMVGVLRPAGIVFAGTFLVLGAMTGMAIGALQRKLERLLLVRL